MQHHRISLDLRQIVDELGTTPSDSLLVILVAFEYYKSMYEDVPEKISAASKNVLAEFKKAADAQAQASMATAKADLAAAVAEAAHKVAKEVAGASKLKWACGCFVVALLCLGGVGWWGHKGGVLEEGIGIGYQQSKDQVAAAAWANTPQGRTAFRMAKSGALEMVSRCDQPEWSFPMVPATLSKPGAGLYMAGWSLDY